MRYTTNPAQRVCSLVLATAILSSLPLSAGLKVRQLKWEQLPIVTGHTVRIALAGGKIIGKAGTVEADVLVVDIRKTSNRSAYPKGTLRIPRRDLRRLEMLRKGKFFRLGSTAFLGTMGVAVGYGVGAYGVDQCDFWSGFCPHGRSAGGIAATLAISAAAIAGGYAAGNVLDTRWTVIEIVP
jgi:hypothetical protein